MKALKDKVIRDTVHGNIIVSKQYVNTILDTDYFQRLRRVEQTSIRSVYPCARHDRFIHSLGVYHIGSLIAEHLTSERSIHFDSLPPQRMRQITESYKVACLVHDIAHAPFSHTFEKYYGKETDLYNKLNTLLKNRLSLNGNEIEDIKPHEYASAILVADKYGLKANIRQIKNVNIELVCRMIIGAEYKDKDEKTIYYPIANCFISLLHGNILDADRIDYACRDVWASGYGTATVDVERIVAAIHIHKHNNSGKYEICYDYNALTELTNMLEIRQFQNRYVINHHIVQYEQELLVRAAETMAKQKYPKENEHDALSRIISIDGLINDPEKAQEYPYICDDDLWYLIKHSTNNPYYEELSSRQYKRFSLWKTIGEFYAIFPQVSKQKEIYKGTFKDDIKKLLNPIIHDDVENIVFCEIKFKADVDINNVPICVGKHHISYKDAQLQFFEQKTKTPNESVKEEIPNKMRFQYIYVPYPKDTTKNILEYKDTLVQALTDYMNTNFGENTHAEETSNVAQPTPQQENVINACQPSLRKQNAGQEAKRGIHYGDETVQ